MRYLSQSIWKDNSVLLDSKANRCMTEHVWNIFKMSSQADNPIISLLSIVSGPDCNSEFPPCTCNCNCLNQNGFIFPMSESTQLLQTSSICRMWFVWGIHRTGHSTSLGAWCHQRGHYKRFRRLSLGGPREKTRQDVVYWYCHTSTMDSY